MRAVSLLAALALLRTAAATAATAAATTSFALQIGVPLYGTADEQAAQQAAAANRQQNQQLLAGLPAWTRATLEAGGGRRHVSAPLTAGGQLVFGNVTAGSYLGEVHCATHAFGPLRVDVVTGGGGKDGAAPLTVEVTETYRGNDWDNRGAALPRVAGGGGGRPTFLVAPLTLQPKSYYAERSTFSVLSLLKNPMMLMALVAMVIMFGMPYMMDQKMRAEFEERQKANPMNSILGGGGGGGAAPGSSFDMAAYLAGSGSKTPKPGAAGRR